ncbi:MAG TPA: hypothetical protein VKW09_14510 [bacterium]|nr:hypothetical protein [bacterium]
MMRLRGTVTQFVAQHRAPVMIVGAAVALLVVWRVVMALSSGGPAPAPVATAPRPAASTAPQGGGAATPNAGATTGATGGGRPDTGGAPAGSGTPGTGRPDPFSPLAGQVGPGSPNAPLPPVPPLSPNTLGASAPGGGEPGAPAVSGSPTTQFRLSGIVDGQVPVAILNDAAGSYIVEPGDTVVSGVRLVAVDAGTQSVTLLWNDQSWQVRLAGGGTTR